MPQHIGGVKVGSLGGGGLFHFRGFLRLCRFGGGGRFLRCGSGGRFSHSRRILVGGLGGLGLRLDLVLRAHNMLILLAVLTVFQDISGSAQGSGTHGQTGQFFQ